jgi:hypothetical protein
MLADPWPHLACYDYAANLRSEMARQLRVHSHLAMMMLGIDKLDRPLTETENGLTENLVDHLVGITHRGVPATEEEKDLIAKVLQCSRDRLDCSRRDVEDERDCERMMRKSMQQHIVHMAKRRKTIIGWLRESKKRERAAIESLESIKGHGDNY